MTFHSDLLRDERLARRERYRAVLLEEQQRRRRALRELQAQLLEHECGPEAQELAGVIRADNNE